MFVVDEPELVPDAAVADDCPSSEIVNVMTEAGDNEDPEPVIEPVPVWEPPAAYVSDSDPGETGMVSTVGDPDGSVMLMTVAELGLPPVGLELEEVLREPDEAPPYDPEDVSDAEEVLEAPVDVIDGDDWPEPEEDWEAVAEVPGV